VTRKTFILLLLVLTLGLAGCSQADEPGKTNTPAVTFPGEANDGTPEPGTKEPGTRPDADATATPTPAVDNEPSITPTSTPTAAVETPTVDSSTEQGIPEILFFEAEAEQIRAGDGLTLRWSVTGASTVTIYKLLPSLQLGTFWEVEQEGSLEITTDVEERNYTRFALFAGDGHGSTSTATLSVPIICETAWIVTPAPEGCPAAEPLFSAAAQQHFEHGIMIWVAERDLVYVLFADGSSPHWNAFGDSWDDSQPESDPAISAPSGKYQPMRGFGLLWRTESTVRDRLGWAIENEVGYTTAIQATSFSKYNDTFILARDGSAFRLLTERSGWENVGS